MNNTATSEEIDSIQLECDIRNKGKDILTLATKQVNKAKAYTKIVAIINGMEYKTLQKVSTISTKTEIDTLLAYLKKKLTRYYLL